MSRCVILVLRSSFFRLVCRRIHRHLTIRQSELVAGGHSDDGRLCRLSFALHGNALGHIVDHVFFGSSRFFKEVFRSSNDSRWIAGSPLDVAVSGPRTGALPDDGHPGTHSVFWNVFFERDHTFGKASDFENLESANGDERPNDDKNHHASHRRFLYLVRGYVCAVQFVPRHFEPVG